MYSTAMVNDPTGLNIHTLVMNSLVSMSFEAG